MSPARRCNEAITTIGTLPRPAPQLACLHAKQQNVTPSLGRDTQSHPGRTQPFLCSFRDKALLFSYPQAPQHSAQQHSLRSQHLSIERRISAQMQYGHWLSILAAATTLLPPALPLSALRMSGVRVEAAARVTLLESSMTCKRALALGMLLATNIRSPESHGGSRHGPGHRCG